MKIDGKTPNSSRTAVMTSRQLRNRNAEHSSQAHDSSRIPQLEPSKRSDTSDVKEASGLRHDDTGSETPLKGLPARKMDVSMASAVARGTGDMIRQAPQQAVRVHGLDVTRAANFL